MMTEEDDTGHRTDTHRTGQDRQDRQTHERHDIQTHDRQDRRGRNINLNLFKLLLELLNNDLDIPETIIPRRYVSLAKTVSKKVVVFYKLASSTLKTISLVLKTTLAFIKWAF